MKTNAISMKHVKAPGSYSREGETLLFLAGSIEMGLAEQWQERVALELADFSGTILNPRRDDWDSTWRHDSPEFNEQVNWELDGLEVADHIFMYYDADTKSPITLEELGLFARSGKLIVVCDDRFWRYGNVRITCKRHKIPLYNNLEEGLKHLKILL